MKKLHFLCAVFVLCLIFTCAAAETIPFEYSQPYDYTQEVVYGNFKIMVPSSFSSRREGTIVGQIHTEFNDDPSGIFLDIAYYDPSPRYRNSGELIDAHLEYVRTRPGYDSLEFARADECIALIMSHKSDFSSIRARIYNMDEELSVYVTHNYSAEDPSEIASLRSLVDGILEHIVAPEMPLE